MAWLAVLTKVLPVLLLLSLGIVLKQSQFISGQAIAELKKLVVYITLPCLLFLAFLNTQFKPKYIWIVIIIILVNLLMLLAGKITGFVLKVKNPYFPLLFTGFEMGMLGISLFGTVYGMQNLTIFGILDLGQELFVWFILTALLMGIRDGSSDFKKIGTSFLTSPPIIAILSGILLNLSGLGNFLTANGLTTGLITCIGMISQLTIPLILIVIGYQLNLRLNQFTLPCITVILRMSILACFALIITRCLFTTVLQLPALFSSALWVMFILPTPFIIPLFMPNQDDENQSYVNNTLSLGTVFTIVTFILVIFFNQ